MTDPTDTPQTQHWLPGGALLNEADGHETSVLWDCPICGTPRRTDTPQTPPVLEPTEALARRFFEVRNAGSSRSWFAPEDELQRAWAREQAAEFLAPETEATPNGERDWQSIAKWWQQQAWQQAQASQRGAAADLRDRLVEVRDYAHEVEVYDPDSGPYKTWAISPETMESIRLVLERIALRPASTPRAVEVEPARLRVTRDALRKMHSYHHQNETLPCYIANTIAYATTLLPDPDPWAALATPPARDGGTV